MDSSKEPVTEILLQWEQGDKQALDRLVPIVYDELRKIAARYMRRERQDHTLQTTAVVNEAYMRLVDQKRVHWKSRAHFFAIAANMIRRILIDYARAKGSAKRGGDVQKLQLEEAAVITDERAEELIELDQALVSLASHDPQQSQIVELRYFGGLSVAETASVLEISSEDVQREWILAKAWLYRQLSK